MNPDHARFAEWDAAYVVGALSTSERRRFEDHLEDCVVCRQAIAEIAPTTGLLSRITPERAQSMLDPAVDERWPDPAARARLVASAVADLRRRRRVRWAGGLAAAAAFAVAVVLAASIAIGPAWRGIRTVALEPIVDVPLTATVELVDVAWGTRIEMICRYEGVADAGWPAEGRPYGLYVTADDGSTSEVSSWRALAGATARLDAGTALNADDIASIEIRSLGSGKVLMRAELPVEERD